MSAAERGWGRLLRRIAGDGTRMERLRGPGVRGLEPRPVDLWLPPGFERRKPAPLLLMLDGQTAREWRLGAALELVAAQGGPAPIVAAIPASPARLDEYGTAGISDFAGRGRLAKLFQDYLVYEVLPAVREHCGLPADRHTTGIFGASMGGLSAFDTAWRHPDVLGVAGVFSGSLWWRTDDSNPVAQQASRIAHRRVRQTRKRPPLRLWFAAGTRDEASDRDGDGVIDAIQDTRELIGELAAKGFQEGRDVVYRQVEGGEHNEATWARALPEFLRWAVGG
ncbi:MAG TPA: alpha/beta hydrolase-fold protein [Opitutaceae bacterium]|nr:alpha/beta hydrolase-fold protein [Opitutaceae bacterium]